MEIIKEKRIKSLEFAHFTRGGSVFRQELESKLKKLSLGDGLIVAHKEYPMKTHISSMVFGINEKIRNAKGSESFSTKTLADKKGWVIIRVK